ncbi:MAG: hypothetical protein AB1546_01765 [bacterium]
MSLYITVAVEGYPDEAVARKICDYIKLNVITIYNKRGKGNLDKHLRGYNNAAKYFPWLVLRDLNHDATCAPELKNRLLPHPAQQMLFKIVVREIEAWLLGDSEKFSKFLGISKTLITDSPELLDDPKSEVINLARRSRKKDIRYDIVPRPGSGAKEGPAYASRLAEFAYYYWRPDIAALKCSSLKYCLNQIEKLKIKSRQI